MSDTSQLANALWALQHGFRVFPCQMGGKDPNGLLVPHGAKESTTSEEQVRKWWAQCPNGNAGIHGGVIVDCDEGINSLEEAEVWREKVGLPPTLAVRTGRRTSYGVQYHYAGETKTGPYELHDVSGEVRSGNAYGMAPGSIHPDTRQRYEIVIDLPKAAYPLNCQLEQAKKKATKKLNQDPAKLKSGEKIKPSSRQYWLVSQCGRLRRTGLSGNPLFAALCALRDQYCEKPEEKTDAMLRQICESGEKNYGVHTPGLDPQTDDEEWPEVAETLKTFNERFYVIENFGGKCRVCAEEPSASFSNSFEFVHQSFPDFKNRFMHQLVKVGENNDGSPIYRDRGSVWLHHKERRQYQQVVYTPAQTLSIEVRNLWRGFAYEPKEGNCSLYLAHLKDNVCQRKQERYDWLIGWMAYSVRYPNEPGHTCPVLLGGQGVGKNSAADPFAHLWGAHYMIVTQKSQFTGHFNAHLRTCSVLIVNEAFFAGDRSQAGPMKGLITDEFLSIEAKGVDVVRTRNLLHVIIVSNEDWVVPGDMDSRRFTVFRTGDEHREDTAYFKAMHEQLKNGGYSALLHHLLYTVDISNFNPRKILATDELNEQKAYSLQGVESVWYECLQRGCLPGKVTEDNTAILRASDLAARVNEFETSGHGI